MARDTTQGLITNFANGEISPLYYGRVDSEFYKAAAKKLTNGIVVQSGAFIRRPGLRFSGSCRYTEKNVRLVALPVGEEQFMLEFGDNYIRFHQDGEIIEDGSGDPVEVVTTWSEDVIHDLSFAAIDGELIVAHGEIKRIVKGSTSTDWSIEDPDWLENSKDDITPPSIESVVLEEGESAVDVLVGNHDMSYNAFRFRSTDVGQRLYIETTGGKTGYFVIDEYVNRRVEARQIEDPDDETKTITHWVDVPYNAAKYTYHEDSGGSISTSDEISKWAMYAGDYSTFAPNNVAAMSGRIIYANFDDAPRDIVGTVVGRKWETRRGTEPNLGYKYTIKEDYGNTIIWIMGGKRLTIGMDGGVYTAASDGPINPSQAFTLVKQSGFNVSKVPPAVMGDMTIYVQNPSTNLRTFTWSEERGQFMSRSLTQQSEHMFRDGIVQIAYQQDPYEILWVVTKDGKMHSYCFNQEGRISAWTTHETVGNFLSVVSVNGVGLQNEIYVAVQRKRNGTWYTHIEKLDFYRLDKWEKCWYVDSGTEWVGSYHDCSNLADDGTITFDSDPEMEVGDVIHFDSDPPGITGVAGNEYKIGTETTSTEYILTDLDDEAISGIGNSTGSFQVREANNTITLPDHFYEDEEVAVFTDKGVVTGATVEADNTVVLENYPSVIRAGYEYTTTINTLPVPIVMKDTKRVYKVGVFFFESNAGYLRDKSGDLSEEIVMDNDIVLDGALDMWTGVKTMSFAGGRDKYGEIIIDTGKPSPMNIMAINYEVEV